MKIAIHHRPNSYSEHWIEYCINHSIPYKIVDAYANDILEQVADCDAFMWHHHLYQYKDYLFAKQLIYTIQQMGKHVYPDYNTCWHYDDKVWQKYLLESIDAPLVPTYIFYSEQECLEWIKHTNYPKVFKLKSGSGSRNVKLVFSYKQAKSLIKQSFNNGFQKNSHLNRIGKRWTQYRNGKCTFKWFLKGIITKLAYKERFNKEEIGYVYFQDYIPNNNFDIRVFIIGNRAVAVKRMNRGNDFRASGSGLLIFDKKQIDIEYVKIAFDLNKKLKMQSVAFDFLKNDDGQIILSEISYCNGIKFTNPIYWTDDMQCHQSSISDICNWIIEDVINYVKIR